MGMTTTGEQYVPSDDQVRGRYCDGTYLQAGHTTEGDDFDAWLARVRRDAAHEALDGLAQQEMVRASGQMPLGKTIATHVAESALTYRDTHYPEEAL